MNIPTKEIAPGVGLVSKHINAFVDFYVSQTQVSAMTTREAACRCLAEIAQKLPSEVVRPYAPRLLEVVDLLHTSSWQVKCAACNAIDRYIAAFPTECLDRWPALVEALWECMEDAAVGTREDAAVAFGALLSVAQSRHHAAPGSPSPVDAVWREKVLEGLKAGAAEPSELAKYQAHDFPAMKNARDNDADLHSNKAMVDCCAVEIAEKGHDHQHEHKHWERTDGCFYLVREVARFRPDLVPSALPLMAVASSWRHFARHPRLLETLWLVLPDVAKAAGKASFKRHLEGFVEAMLHSLRLKESPNTVDKCKACIEELVKFVGPLIFSGRVREMSPLYLDELAVHVPAVASTSRR